MSGSDHPTAYLASSFSLKRRVQRVYDVLSVNGIHVPDVWWDDSREDDGQADLKSLNIADDEWYQHERVVSRANRHWRTIDSVDAFAIVCPYDDKTKKFNGANIELGYAIGKGVPCFSVGRLERSAMYEPVTQLGSAQELANEISDLYDTENEQEEL